MNNLNASTRKSKNTMARFYIAPNKICVSCRAENVPLIKLNSCSHNLYFRCVFLCKINIKTSRVCQHCHGILKKIENFRKQVIRSLAMLKQLSFPEYMATLDRTNTEIISVDPESVTSEPTEDIVENDHTLAEQPNIGKYIKEDLFSRKHLKSYLDQDETVGEHLINNDLEINVPAWQITAKLPIVKSGKKKLSVLKLFETLQTTKTENISNDLETETPQSQHNNIKTEHISPEPDIKQEMEDEFEDLKSDLDLGETVIQGLIYKDLETEVPAWEIPRDNIKIPIVKDKDPDDRNDKTKETEHPYDKLYGKIRMVFHNIEEIKNERQMERENDSYQRRPYKCGLCVLGFANINTYENHVKIHNKSRGKYICFVCKSVFASVVTLKIHESYHWNRYQCMECRNKYKTERICIAHYNRMHAENGQIIDNKYACNRDNCNYITNDYNTYLQHRLRHKKKQFRGSLSTITKHLKYVCTYCDAEFVWRGHLKNHIEFMHRYRQYRCIHCAKGFRWRGILRKHIKRTHERDASWPNTICFYCGLGFTTPAVLRTHDCTHTGDVPQSSTLYKHNQLQHKLQRL